MIKTAEEIFEKCAGSDYGISREYALEAMKEYDQSCCEDLMKAIADRAIEMTYILPYDQDKSGFQLVERKTTYAVDKQSILKTEIILP